MDLSSTDAAAEVVWFDDDRWVDEADLLLTSDPPPEIALADLQASGAAHTAAVLAVEAVTVRGRVLAAEQYAGIAHVISDAAACPDPWVGPDPTLDPTWRDPQDRTAGAVRAERRDIAVRAAALDLAVRLGLSAAMIRTRAAHADTLRTRCPRVWEAFLSGRLPEQNAITAARQAASLPGGARKAWASFDERVVASAAKLPPGKFRMRARVVRERVHPESVDVRHRRAAQDRAVWLDPEHDGMAILSIFGPAADLYAAYGRVDAHARHLRAQPDESRTLAQLRADVFADLVVHGETAQSGPAAGRPSVAITVPVLTLLDHDPERDSEPAVLDGYGPIDGDTAKRLAGEASSWVRILTHPVTGTVLDLDRKTYRVPKALRRWLGVRDPVCVGPGCTRPARDCDADHRLDWQYGGATSADNTAPLCEPDHIIKTKSNWVLHRDPVTGTSWWVTPTALRVDVDPPPW